jgi:hypothetical protein
MEVFPLLVSGNSVGINLNGKTSINISKTDPLSSPKELIAERRHFFFQTFAQRLPRCESKLVPDSLAAVA